MTKQMRGSDESITLSTTDYRLSFHLRQDAGDALLLRLVLRHREGLSVGLGGELLVSLCQVGLSQAVVGVPGLGVVLDVLAEDGDRLVELLLAEQLVAVEV